MCNWSKGINIRYNISQLEQWVRDSRLQESGAVETLETVIQASQLLQARKSESDIKSICEMCSKLTIAQVQRILFMYTPLESYEEKLNRSFINKVVETLKDLRKYELNDAQQVLTLDTKKPFSVYIPFNPSNISLETIEIPEQLGLHFLKKSWTNHHTIFVAIDLIIHIFQYLINFFFHFSSLFPLKIIYIRKFHVLYFKLKNNYYYILTWLEISFIYFLDWLLIHFIIYSINLYIYLLFSFD